MNWSAITRWRRRKHVTLRVFAVLLLSQVVSFTIALMAFTSSFIAELGVDAPLTQSFFTYTALVLVYGSIMLYRRQKPLVSWYWYLLLGFADVQGNYLFNKAFQYTSITSATLLDSLIIAWVMILTWIFLGTRYSLWQLFGAALCVAGLGLVLLSDSGVGGGGGSKPLLGDVLVIGAILFCGLTNVGEEYCVKKKDRVEVVAMIGVYGFIVTAIEVPAIELKSVESIKWSAYLVLALVGYVLSSFMNYTLTPFVLKLSGATMFNLSLLTSDMWAVVFKVFFHRQEVDWLYFLSFGIVIIGLVVYSTTAKDFGNAAAIEEGNANTEYQVLHDETSASANNSSVL